MKLIYHKIGTAKEVSPFDEALFEVVRHTPLLRLASPYIGLNFLQRVLAPVSDWRLLSDIEAWLRSENRMHRAKCWEFITDNLENIRHVAGLHAKVAMGNKNLFLGSANFTDKGILGRAELSILISEQASVDEAIAWFDALWDTASPPILEEGDALVSALDSAEWTIPRMRVKLTNTAPKIAAVLAERKQADGFDLAATMAKAGILESDKLESLEKAYRHVSDDWANSHRTFTFFELTVAVNQFHSGGFRDIWQLATTETANHWLGGLDTEGFDRYIYKGGYFRPFNAPGDNSETAALGKILAFVLNSIPFYPAREPLPLEDAWLDVGIAETHILPTTELLLSAGLLMEHDIPGEIESYSVDPDFEWPRRWKKFIQAMNLFHRTKKTQPPTNDEGVDEPEPDEEKFSHYALGPSESHIEQEIAKQTKRDLEKEAKWKARKLGLPLDQMLSDHDRVLAALFDVLAARPKPIKISREEISHEMKNVGIVDSLCDAFRGGYSRSKVQGSGALLTVHGGLEFNKQWRASVFLGLYPKALESWRKAVRSS